MKKKFRFTQKFIAGSVFVVSSFVLFVNNLTDLFRNYNTPYNLNIITWAAIIISVMWWMFLFAKENKMW